MPDLWRSVVRSGRAAQDGLTPLEADPGCCNHLNWRCGSLNAVSAEALERNLTVHGYQLRCRHSGLWLLRHSDGHEIAWVRAHNRFQLRVPIALPPRERAQAAQIMYRQLSHSLTPAPETA